MIYELVPFYANMAFMLKKIHTVLKGVAALQYGLMF
jgi:hypothetical protein